MAAYNTKKRPDSFPVKYHQAFERVIGGQIGLTYETCLGVFTAERQYWHSQHLSAFKAVVRKYPLHPLHGVIPKTRTRLRSEPLGDGSVNIWLGVTLYSPPSSLLETLLE